jgi:hypothetical protein
MRKDQRGRRTSLTLETLEGKLLLSTAASTVAAQAAQVHILNQSAVGGTINGVAKVTNGHLTLSNGTGKIPAIGGITLSGDVFTNPGSGGIVLTASRNRNYHLQVDRVQMVSHVNKTLFYKVTVYTFAIDYHTDSTNDPNGLGSGKLVLTARIGEYLGATLNKGSFNGRFHPA